MLPNLPKSCLYQELPEKFVPKSMICWNTYFIFFFYLFKDLHFEMPILDVLSKVTEWIWFQFTYFGVTSLNGAEDHNHQA